MKQTIITLFGEGYLNNVNLKDENNVIKGTVSIKTGEAESVLFNVHCYRLTKNGDKNFKYDIFKAVMNEYKSSNNEPDYKKTDKIYIKKHEVKNKIYPNATIKTDTYLKDGKLVDGMKYQVDLLNKKDNDFLTSHPKFSFTVENLLVESILPEYDSKGEPTNRGILNGYCINNHELAAKASFVLGKEGYDYAKTAWACGDTVNISGDIISKKVKKITLPTNVAFGSLHNDDADKWINENLIVGAEEKLVDGFSSEDITTVMMNYDNKKEKLLSEQTFLSSGIDSPIAGFVSVPMDENSIY